MILIELTIIKIEIVNAANRPIKSQYTYKLINLNKIFIVIK